MKWIVFIGLAFFCSGCSGPSSYDWDREHELRHDRRVDCTQTKSTDEGANITNCPQIRPDGEKTGTN